MNILQHEIAPLFLAGMFAAAVIPLALSVLPFAGALYGYTVARAHADGRSRNA